MTSKLSWIGFIPFTLAAIGIKIIQLLFLEPNGTFFGFDNLTLSYLAIACALAVFLFACIFCLIDRKTASVYSINRNVFSGIFGILLAVCLACEGANRAFLAMRSMSGDVFNIIDIVLTVLCAIVFVVLGLNHFVGNGGVQGLAVFYLVPALWSAFRLVNCFLSFTTVSIAVTDVTVLACYIFTTLFLFNYAMIVALMKGKSPVRATFIYGLPSITLLLSYGIYELINVVLNTEIKFSVFNNLPIIEFLLLALYILSFVVELSACVKRKDEIVIIDETQEADYEDVAGVEDAAFAAVNNNNSDITVDEVVTRGGDDDVLSNDDQVFIEITQNSLNNADEYFDDSDTSDFIYGKAPSDDDFILPVNSDDLPYEMHVEENIDSYITKAESTYDDEEVADGEISMDRIDRLILEISEDEVS